MTREITIQNHQFVADIVGSQDRFLKIISKTFDIKIHPKGNLLILDGGDQAVGKAEQLVHILIETVKNGFHVDYYDLNYAIKRIQNDKEIDFNRIFSRGIKVSLKGKIIHPRTYGQLEYINAIQENDIVISIGPAGTGKTYLAMAMAVDYLVTERVKKIILTRPVVEAGESLGFLPGTLEDKINPYLKPLYDALFDMMTYEKFLRLLNTNVIEIAPLAYMRGRTLNDAFIVLDEAQNTNPEQIKMFLTRIGVNSKAVLTGDITQIDLPSSRRSGLVQVQEILKDISGIRFIYLDSDDVVRHYLVQKIIDAYEKFNKNNQ